MAGQKFMSSRRKQARKEKIWDSLALSTGAGNEVQKRMVTGEGAAAYVLSAFEVLCGPALGRSDLQPTFSVLRSRADMC